MSASSDDALFSVAADENAEGRKLIRDAATNDSVLTAMGNALFAAGKGLAIVHGGPLAGLGADIAREALEAAIRRDASAAGPIAAKVVEHSVREINRRLGRGDDPSL